jgi:uncharacterized protein YndB with AHSA1/START domain
MADAPTPTLTEHTIQIRRTFDAPRELVWAAFTDPDQLTKWWGPQGFHVPRESIEVDLRPCGVFALTMVGPDGAAFPDRGTFQEVVMHERLAFGGQVEGFEQMTSAHTDVAFVDLGDGRTEIVVQQTMVAVEEMPEMARQGWSSQFDKLDDLLGAD